MSLKGIIGQEKAVKMLIGALERDRVAGAYLFYGEPGVGKKTTAINFAKALNCLENSGRGGATPPLQITTFDACDECDSCIKIESGRHADLLIVSPEERLIKIDEIRRVDEALSFRPFEGRKKVIIVDDADSMNIAASNAFLKTLEEPPEDSVIILVSSRPDRLLPTIRSRCSGITFGALPPDACLKILSDRIPGKTIEIVARLSMGRPGLALSGDLLEERDWFLNLFKAMLNFEKDGWTSREDMERWFAQALGLFRDMAVLKITGGNDRLNNIDLADFIKGLSKSADLQGIISIYRELDRIKGLLLFNLNRSVTWNYTAALLRKELTV